MKNLFNLSSFLTKRDEWAGSFDELLAEAPRDDAPLHLPAAPPAADPWDPPPGQAVAAREAREAARRAGERGVPPEAMHCSSPHGKPESKCRDPQAPNRKQKRNARLLAGLLDVPAPDVDAMSWLEAERFIGRHWKAFMERKEEL